MTIVRSCLRSLGFLTPNLVHPLRPTFVVLGIVGNELTQMCEVIAEGRVVRSGLVWKREIAGVGGGGDLQRTFPRLGATSRAAFASVRW